MTGIMTSELIRQLKELFALHGDLPVKVEGCDCYGECSGAGKGGGSRDDDPFYVLVQREGGVDGYDP